MTKKGLVKMEKSTLNSALPKYNRGYDVDILLEKLSNGQILTQNERTAVNEVIRSYYDAERKRVRLSNKKEPIKRLKIHGKIVYEPGTLINNPFIKPLES